MSVKEDAAQHYRREVDYYKMILNLNRDTSDVKQTYVHKIKQLSSDNEKLSALESIHKSAILNLKHENARVKQELEVYRNRDKDSFGPKEANRISFSNSNKMDSNLQELKVAPELGKTLDFKSKFNHTPKPLIFTEHSSGTPQLFSSILENKLPPISLRTAKGFQTARQSIQGPLEDLILDKGNKTASVPHRRIASESLDSVENHMQRNSKFSEIGGLSPVPRQLGSPTQRMGFRLPLGQSKSAEKQSLLIKRSANGGQSGQTERESTVFKNIDLKMSVDISREDSDTQLGISPEQKKDTFYANYQRFKNRIKELQRDIDDSEVMQRNNSNKRKMMLQNISPLKGSFSIESRVGGKGLLKRLNPSRLRTLDAIAKSQDVSVNRKLLTDKVQAFGNRWNPGEKTEQRGFFQTPLDSQIYREPYATHLTSFESSKAPKFEPKATLNSNINLKQVSKNQKDWSRPSMTRKHESSRIKRLKQLYNIGN